jgi:hypothetical protein
MKTKEIGLDWFGLSISFSKKANLVTIVKSVFDRFYWFIEQFLSILKTSIVTVSQTLAQTTKCCVHITLYWATSGTRSASQVDEKIHLKWRGDKKVEGYGEDRE